MAETRNTKVGAGGIVREIQVAVPDGEPAIWDADAKLRVVGTNVPRVDGIVKATGTAKYTTDVHPPKMAHARFLRSPRAEAKITLFDLSAAEKAPGVLLVKALAKRGDRMLIDGDDVAMVVAETEDQAEDALRLCKLQVEGGEVYTTPEAAMAPGAHSIHSGREDNERRGPNSDKPGVRDNIEAQISRVEQTMSQADFVLDRTYRTPVQTHSPLEPHGFVIRPDDDGGVTVWASTQGTFSVRDGLAQALGLGAAQVRVVTEHMGGGFGAKFGPSAQGSGFGIHAARAAMSLKRPVRAILTRREQHLVTGNRPSSVQRVKLGVNKDGKIIGYTVRAYGTAGYAEGGAGVRNPMIYELGQTAKDEVTVVTHAGPQAAFRAPGHPQGSFALEQAVDEAAWAIGMDPLAFRRGLVNNPLREMQLDEGAKRFDWAAKRAGSRGTGALRTGVGVASAIWYQAGGKGSTVLVTVHRDGTVEVSNGAQDIGTGTRTVLAILAAEVLGMAPSEVRVNLGRTELPSGPGSGGSTTAPSLGPCVRAAAEKAKAEIMGADAPASPTPAQWKAACARMEPESRVFEGGRADPYNAFQKQTAGVQFAEVEVDIETGVVRVLRVLAIQDCGRVIDRLTAESQVIGGVIGGISYALFEERTLDPLTGRLLHGDLDGYKLAGARDCPQIEAVMTDVANAGNSIGMMGLGEAPAVPTAGAIANAVFHATGARVRRIPMTPARVLAALDQPERK